MSKGYKDIKRDSGGEIKRETEWERKLGRDRVRDRYT